MNRYLLEGWKFYLPSASAMPRVMVCPESEALPSAVEAAGEYAKGGTTVHDFMLHISTHGPEAREEALAAIPLDDPGRQICEDVDVDTVLRGGHFEPAFTWNPDTGEGRLIGENIDRRYEEHGAKREIEYVGSGDMFGVLPDRRAVIVDYKTGRPMRARDSWQLKTLAVMAAATAKVDEVIASHLVIRGSSVFWDTVEWDALAIAGFAEELRALAKRLRKMPAQIEPAKANVIEGDWCKFCPAFNRCPAKTGLIRELVDSMTAGGALDTKTSVSVTTETAAFAWRKLDQFDEMAKRMRAQIAKLAEQTPIDLGNGFELRVAEGDAKDRVTDSQKAFELLAKHYDERTAREAAGANKTGITDAVKAWARRNGAALRATEEQAIEMLRREGVIVKQRAEEKVREVRR